MNSIEIALKKRANMEVSWLTLKERKRAQEVTEKAMDVIHELGWSTHTYQDKETSNVCIQGALRIACHGDVNVEEHHTEPCYMASLEFIKRVGVAPSFYNDAPGRSVEEVLLTMKQVAHGDIVTDRIV